MKAERDDRGTEIFGDLAVELDRGNIRAGGHEPARDGAEPGTDLKDGLAGLRIGFVENLRAELVVHEKILPEAFARRDAELFEKRFEFGFDHGTPLLIDLRRLFAHGQIPIGKILGGYLQVATLKSSCIVLFAHLLKNHPFE